MAKTQVKFLSGYQENLPELIVNGQVYFVVSEDGKGKILFDKNNKRYVMAEIRDSGSIQMTKQYYQIGPEDIFENNLVSLDKNGLIVPAITSPFLVNSPLFISASNLVAKEVGDKLSFYNQHHNIMIKKEKEEINGIKYKTLYLKGIIQKGYFYPSKSDPFVYNLPTFEDNYYYISIGEINSFTSTNNNYTYLNFNATHPIYRYYNGEIQPYVPNSHAEVAEKLAHTLTIGEYEFDGSEDVIVPIYGGETIQE